MLPVNEALRVVPYADGFKDAFYSINMEWLEEFFTPTPGDLEFLHHPERILSAGGEIFFALERDQPVGTVAMLAAVSGEMELAKMGVLSSLRRKGTGSLLMQAAVDFARACKANQIMLETSYRLPHAIALYEKFGFIKVGEEYIHPVYGRKIFKMVLTL